jgi:2-methylcitrate dehydratase PrpD
MSATGELIAYIQSIDSNAVPSTVVAQTKRCVLDLLGVGIAGRRTTMAEVSIKFARHQFPRGDATLFGSRLRLNEIGATWVNGTCASALDMDDGHRLAMGHPGAAVIPTALAFAETTGISGPEFLTAIVAGYEMAVRVSRAMLPDYRAGRYSTGIWGGFGSVAAAAKLLGLESQSFQDALGIVAAQGPSPPRGDFLHDSMVKETVAWAGVAGCASVLLAQEGFKGPDDVLDESKRYDTAQLVQDLGVEHAISETYFKPYASCRWSHPAIDGVLKLASQHDLHLAEIEGIQVEGFQATTMLCDYTPANTVAAQYSIPFSVALALSHGKIGPEQLTPANLQDPELLGLAQKVQVSVDPELDRLFPEKTATRVIIHTGRGEFSTTVEYPKGDPSNPMSDAELQEKFRWLTAGFVGEEKSNQLREAIDQLDQMKDVKQLARLLTF